MRSRVRAHPGPWQWTWLAAQTQPYTHVRQRVTSKNSKYRWKVSWEQHTAHVPAQQLCFSHGTVEVKYKLFLKLFQPQGLSCCCSCCGCPTIGQQSSSAPKAQFYPLLTTQGDKEAYDGYFSWHLLSTLITLLFLLLTTVAGAWQSLSSSPLLTSMTKVMRI